MASEIKITCRPALETMPLADAGAMLECDVEHHRVECVNWPEVASYCPRTEFCIAHSREALYVHFITCGEDLRAVNTAPLSPVADDSCVEIFMQLPGSDEYWNFEFNCIGTVNASHRVERDKPVRLSPEQIAMLGTAGTCGTAAIEPRTGVHEWRLTVRVPFALLGVNSGTLPQRIMANVYKCAGKTAHPHYVSWQPIGGDRPNFHVPSSFVPLVPEV